MVGAIIGYLYDRWAAKQSDPGFAQRMGVLGATGLIVGDSLFNVVYAGIVAASNNPDVLAVTSATGWQTPVGVVLFIAIVALIYLRSRSAASQPMLVTDEA